MYLLPKDLGRSCTYCTTLQGRQNFALTAFLEVRALGQHQDSGNKCASSPTSSNPADHRSRASQPPTSEQHIITLSLLHRRGAAFSVVRPEPLGGGGNGKERLVAAGDRPGSALTVLDILINLKSRPLPAIKNRYVAESCYGLAGHACWPHFLPSAAPDDGCLLQCAARIVLQRRIIEALVEEGRRGHLPRDVHTARLTGCFKALTMVHLVHIQHARALGALLGIGSWNPPPGSDRAGLH